MKIFRTISRVMQYSCTSPRFSSFTRHRRKSKGPLANRWCTRINRFNRFRAGNVISLTFTRSRERR